MSASAGRVLIIPKGDYNSQTTYTMLDMVYYGGKSYICKQTSTGNLPTNNVYWQIMLDGASALNDLTDVNITDPQNGDGIAYNATTHVWENTTPVGIIITSPPATTDYSDGDILDLTGMVVMAEYSTGQTRNITTECTFSPANGATLTTANTSVTVTWRTFTATQAISVSYPIYGVEWDGSASPVFTRTDAAADFVDPVPYYSGMTDTPSSPFDNISPWKDIKIVDMTSVPYAGYEVEIPKFYYKRTIDDTTGKTKLQIADWQFPGSSVSPLHMDRGDGQGERDVAYISRYDVAQSYYAPIPNAEPLKQNISSFKSTISASNNLWVWDLTALETIKMLYLVEYADWNCQKTIGRGGSTNGSSVDVNGLTDNMPYHTGTMATSRNSTSPTQYRYMENLWGNQFDLVDGTYIVSGKLYVTKNPADSYADYVDTGITLSGNTFCIKRISQGTNPGCEWATAPTENLGSSGNYDSYICDSSTTPTNSYIMSMGAQTPAYDSHGLFYTGWTATNYANNTTRYMYLPSA